MTRRTCTVLGNAERGRKRVRIWCEGCRGDTETDLALYHGETVDHLAPDQVHLIGFLRRHGNDWIIDPRPGAMPRELVVIDDHSNTARPRIRVQAKCVFCDDYVRINTACELGIPLAHKVSGADHVVGRLEHSDGKWLLGRGATTNPVESQPNEPHHIYSAFETNRAKH